MKNNIRKIIFVLGIICLFLCVGCENEQKFYFDEEEIIVFEEMKLPLFLENIDYSEVEVVSDNEDVIMIDGENIIPMYAGKATISVIFNDKTISIDALVMPKVNMDEEIKYGEYASFSIENGNISDYNISFSEPIAYFKNEKIYSKGVGEVEVAFKNKENEEIFSKKYLKILPIQPVLSSDTNEIEVAEYVEFFVENYENIEMFNLYSSDETIISIEEDGYGYALKPGKVVITAKLKNDESITSTFEVTVKNYEIEYKLSQYILLKGDEFKLDYYNYSNDDEFYIEIGDEKIIQKIGEKSYKALDEGNTSITFTLKEDPTISKTIDLIVYIREPILKEEYDKLMVGDRTNIQFLNYFYAEEFIWQINDENIASLEQNALIAKKSGIAIVTITKKSEPSIVKKINIEIIPRQPELLVSSSNLVVGGKTNLFIKNIDELETDDFSKYNVIVEDSSIVKIEDDIVTALKLGSTIIRVESKENKNIKGEVEINVIKTSEVTDSNGEPAEGTLVLYSDDPKNSVLAGEFLKLHIDGAIDNENYKWVSTNTEIAIVNDKGRIIAVNKGITQIAAISKTNKEVMGLIYVTVYGEPNVDYAARLVKIAAEEIGYQEVYDNDTKYGEWYNLNYQPWCAMFVSWCANQAGISTDIIPKYCRCTDGRK